MIVFMATKSLSTVVLKLSIAVFISSSVGIILAISSFSFVKDSFQLSSVSIVLLKKSDSLNLSSSPPSSSIVCNTDAKGFINLSPNLDMANKTPASSAIDILVPRPPS